MEIVEKVLDFIQDQDPRTRNKWIRGNNLSVYIRKGVHPDPEGNLASTLDLANLYSSKRGRGIFTVFLTEIEQLSPLPVYIESVENKRLEQFLIKRGYTLIPGSVPPSYVLDGKTLARSTNS